MKHKIWQICTLSKDHIVNKKRHIEATINTIIKTFKIFHLKIPLYENMLFWQKDP
jgi:hypothetical protein